MSDFFFADVLRCDSQVGICTADEVAKQAFYGWNRAVGIVAEADGQGLCADVGEGQSTGSGVDEATAGAFLISVAGRAPVANHAGGGVFEPTQAFAGEV